MSDRTDIGQNSQEIIDGRQVPHESLPSIVAVVRADNGGQFCTGTLIQNNLVLTAAHCVKDQDFKIGIIHGFEHYLDAKKWDIIPAAEIVMHPGYNPEETGNNDDMALMLLEYAVPEDPCVPILPTSMYHEYINKDSVVTIAGYGRSTPKGSGGILYSANTVVTEVYRQSFITGGPGLPDICFGDSGGPTYIEVDGQDYVVGVTIATYSEDCNGGLHHFPGSYLPWIHTTYEDMLLQNKVERSIDDIDLSSGKCTFSYPEYHNPSPPDFGCATVKGKTSTSGAWLVLASLVMLGRRRKND